MTASNRRPGGRPVLVLVGATGTGKTAVAHRLAPSFGAEILSADSRQVYRDLSAGTSKPAGEWRSTPEGLRYIVDGVVYHGLDLIPATDFYTAGRFVREATAVLNEWTRRRIPGIVVGGTGLYLRSFVRGLAPLPERDPLVRSELERMAAEQGRTRLHGLLEQVDPAAARAIPVNNLQRVLRALEVFRLTGRPLTEWQERETRGAPWDFRWVGLRWPRPRFQAHLRERCRSMADGLVAECRTLLDRGVPASAPGLQSLGYREARRYIQGDVTKEAFLDEFIRRTWQYAKRQDTWFRGEKDVRWVDVPDPFDPRAVAAAVQTAADDSGASRSA